MIDNLTLFNGGSASDTSAWKIGAPYIIRTVTMTNTGRVVAVTPNEIVLEDAAWIPDSGRWADALSGKAPFNEVEPFPNGRVIIGRGAVVDAAELTIELPRRQK